MSIKLHLGRFRRAPSTQVTTAEAAPLSTPPPDRRGTPDTEERTVPEGEAPRDDAALAGRGVTDAEFGLYIDGIALLTPRTAAAKEWLDTHIDPNAEWFGDSLPIELNYLTDIIAAIEMHGFKVESTKG